MRRVLGRPPYRPSWRRVAGLRRHGGGSVPRLGHLLLQRRDRCPRPIRKSGHPVYPQPSRDPGWRVPGDHVPWAQEERFEILSGTATVRLGKQTLILMPGDDLVIPAGTAHGLRNEGTDQLRVLTELRLAAHRALL